MYLYSVQHFEAFFKKRCSSLQHPKKKSRPKEGETVSLPKALVFILFVNMNKNEPNWRELGKLSAATDAELCRLSNIHRYLVGIG